MITVNRWQECRDAVGAPQCGMGLEDSGQTKSCQTVRWTPAITTNLTFEPKRQWQWHDWKQGEDSPSVWNTTKSQACEPKAIYIQQIICLLDGVTWLEVQKCKLTGVLSSPDTTAYLSPVSPPPDVHESPNDAHSLPLLLALVYLRKRMKFFLKLTLKCVTHVHKHTHIRTHRYIQLGHGWTIFESLLTGSRWRRQGQLLLPHLCSAVRAQSSLWTAYYPDTAPGESNQLQRYAALTPDGVGDESSHYISAG